MLNGTSSGRSTNGGGTAKITNPVYTENLRAYNQLSQTLSSLHAQQVFFGGFYGHNDPITPPTHTTGGTFSLKPSQIVVSRGQNNSTPYRSSTATTKEILVRQAPTTAIYQKRMNRLRKLLTEKVMINNGHSSTQQ